ncbi:hypothetical protein [Thalassotalea sp. G2M2-11]|uniref:hypothetical protein n=1 Tax=Thalassotalea sp. G2M2-11 TaxID=2787627 RepID=UPI0019D26588|nr:hypothetical protein [Thalassotalea sp. G2M2-11]
MSKKHYHYACYAILLHAMLLWIISQTLVIPIPQQLKPKAITSYLYQAPAKQPPPVESQSTTDEPINTENTASIEHTEMNESVTVSDELTAKKEKNQQAPSKSQQNADKALNPAITQQKSETQKYHRFSPSQQLQALSQSLDNQNISEQVFEYSRKKSPSIMHGTPKLVPHSKKQPSTDEKISQATQQLTSGMKIIKGDNGSCVIERDLSSVGMEGITVLEGFSCGQTKFEKNFNAHMKKVLKKLGK